MTLSLGAQRLLLQTLGAAALVTALGGCAPLMVGGMATSVLVASDRRTSGIQLEDQGIELRASNRLREVLADRGHVSITSYSLQVLLTGEVPTEQDKQAVQLAMAGIENVQSVVNELAVLGNSTLGQRSSDILVTGRVKAALVDTQDLISNAFKVVTERGTVYLMGRVTQREADRATAVVRQVTGVQRVVRVLEVISEQELQRISPPAQETKAAATGA